MNQCCDTDTSLSVCAEMFLQMSVSVHSHFCISLVRCFCVQRKGHFIILVSLVPCVAAFGVDVVACGVPQLLSDPDFRPTFAPSGRAKPKARTAGPVSVLLLGSRKVSGDRCLAGGFLCPLRHSKVCFELPETLRVTPASLAPERGRGFLSEVGKPVSTCGAYAGSYAHAVTPLNP